MCWPALDAECGLSVRSRANELIYRDETKRPSYRLRGETPNSSRHFGCFGQRWLEEQHLVVGLVQFHLSPDLIDELRAELCDEREYAVDSLL